MENFANNFTFWRTFFQWLLFLVYSVFHGIRIKLGLLSVPFVRIGRLCIL